VHSSGCHQVIFGGTRGVEECKTWSMKVRM
jgi:hypothetical protein